MHEFNEDINIVIENFFESQNSIHNEGCDKNILISLRFWDNNFKDHLKISNISGIESICLILIRVLSWISATNEAIDNIIEIFVVVEFVVSI